MIFMATAEAVRYCGAKPVFVDIDERMDGIQGAALQVKLKHLDRANQARRANARFYDQHLAEVEEVILPREAEYARHVYHLYVVRVQNRDRVLQAMANRGIACGIH